MVLSTLLYYNQTQEGPQNQNAQPKETAHTINALFLAGAEYIPYTESGLTQVLREGMGS